MKYIIVVGEIYQVVARVVATQPCTGCGMPVGANTIQQSCQVGEGNCLKAAITIGNAAATQRANSCR